MAARIPPRDDDPSRYGILTHGGDPIHLQNFELISDRPFETMLAELKRLKQEYPDRVLIASIMVSGGVERGCWRSSSA